MADFVTRDQRKRLARQTMHLQADRALKPRRVTFVALAQAPFQLGVARLPDLVSNMNAPEIDVPPPEV